MRSTFRHANYILAIFRQTLRNTATFRHAFLSTFPSRSMRKESTCHSAHKICCPFSVTLIEVNYPSRSKGVVPSPSSSQKRVQYSSRPYNAVPFPARSKTNIKGSSTFRHASKMLSIFRYAHSSPLSDALHEKHVHFQSGSDKCAFHHAFCPLSVMVHEKTCPLSVTLSESRPFRVTH